MIRSRRTDRSLGAVLDATSRPAPRLALACAALAAASAGMTLGFACAAPFAAFAAIAARVLPRRAGIVAMLLVWAVNQALGFACLHYPRDASSVEWGVGLGAIGLVSLAAARVAAIGPAGVGRTLAGFAAAFAAYEGLVLLGCAASGPCAGAFAPRVVERVFAINAVSFGALLAAATLVTRGSLGADRRLLPAGGGSDFRALNPGR